MTELIVESLDAFMDQEIKATRDVRITAIRPYILKHGNPSGNIKFQLRDSNKKLIAETATLDISSIDAADYFHGVVLFDLDATVQKDQIYFFRMVSGGGYSETDNDYVGWVNDLNFGVYDKFKSGLAGALAPLKIEVWERDRGRSV